MPETCDPEMGIDPLQEASGRPRILPPRGVDLVAARIGQGHHIHQGAELDVLKLVHERLGHRHRVRWPRRGDSSKGSRVRRADQVGVVCPQRDDDRDACRDRLGRRTVMAHQHLPGRLDATAPAIDIVCPEVSGHGKRVAIKVEIARFQLDIPRQPVRDRPDHGRSAPPRTRSG